MANAGRRTDGSGGRSAGGARCEICVRGGVGGDRGEGWRIEMRRCTEETDDGRVAVVELRHSVEQMSDQPRTMADGRRGDVRGSNTVYRVNL